MRRCFFFSSRLVVLTKRLRRALEGGGGGGSLALGLMPLHVERQVVRPGERPLAYSALEGLGARVLAVVAGQLVRPREAPLAFWPLAVIGLLSCAGKEEKKKESRFLVKRLHTEQAVYKRVRVCLH